MNYFELFEIPVSIQPDRGYLTKKYLELQRKYHPDYFTLAGEEGQLMAIEKTAQINQAYKALKNEDETIKYILQLKGVLQEEEKYDLPPEFLMEIMELNEFLMDNGNNAVREKIDTIEQDIYEPVHHIILNYTDAKASLDDLQKLKEYYYKKKYLHRILDRING